MKRHRPAPPRGLPLDSRLKMGAAKRMMEEAAARVDDAARVRCDECGQGGAPIKVLNTVTEDVKVLCYGCGDPNGLLPQEEDFSGCWGCNGGPPADDVGPWGLYALRDTNEMYCICCIDDKDRADNEYHKRKRRR